MASMVTMIARLKDALVLRIPQRVPLHEAGRALRVAQTEPLGLDPFNLQHRSVVADDDRLGSRASAVSAGEQAHYQSPDGQGCPGSAPFWSVAWSLTSSGPTTPAARLRSRMAAPVSRASALVGALTLSAIRRRMTGTCPLRVVTIDYGGSAALAHRLRRSALPVPGCRRRRRSAQRGGYVAAHGRQRRARRSRPTPFCGITSVHYNRPQRSSAPRRIPPQPLNDLLTRLKSSAGPHRGILEGHA